MVVGVPIRPSPDDLAALRLRVPLVVGLDVHDGSVTETEVRQADLRHAVSGNRCRKTRNVFFRQPFSHICLFLLDSDPDRKALRLLRSFTQGPFFINNRKGSGPHIVAFMDGWP